ncbi:MAG: hypothetical protein ACRC2O_00195, partial [Chitinophagaceae bacterium]
AGGLSLLYEAGFLRYIKAGETEILRLINLAVRDQNWGTIPFKITNERIEKTARDFKIEYDAECRQDNIQYKWSCLIRGNENNIEFSIVGESLSNFLSNRIGFTILHPIDTCSGKICNITHPDKSKEDLCFPVLISPAQPFKDIIDMAWNPSGGISVSLRFSGEIFETEDQRNWIDASYKTYCTPLSKPFPVQVNSGEKIHQTVLLEVQSNHTKELNNILTPTFHLNRNHTFSFPAIGIPLSNLRHDDFTVGLLKELNIDFLRIEIVIQETIDLNILEEAKIIAEKLGCKLELVLFFGEQFRHDFVEFFLPYRQHIHQFIILSNNEKCTNEKLLCQVVPRIREHFPENKIGAGTDAFFAELNRARTNTELIDFLTFSINPQVHATDLNSLTENLATHLFAVESCRAFSKGKDVHVGPVTFKMRWNPNASSVEKTLLQSQEIPPYADARQVSLYGAGWTMASFKYLIEGQAKAITFFQTSGWAGLISNPKEPWPDEFGMPENYVYPAYLIVKEIMKQKEKKIIQFISNAPLIYDGIAFEDTNNQLTLFLVNFTSEKQNILLPAELNLKNVTYFDSSNIEIQMINPVYKIVPEQVNPHCGITLNAFGLAMID